MECYEFSLWDATGTPTTPLESISLVNTNSFNELSIDYTRASGIDETFLTAYSGRVGLAAQLFKIKVTKKGAPDIIVESN